MIIKKISFKNFKSFSNEVNSQNLDKLDILTLIYGENNSGKSNLLKFIDLIFKAKTELEDSVLVSGQSISKPTEKSPFWKGRIINDAFLFHKNNRAENISFEILLRVNISEISELENSASIIKEMTVTGSSFDLTLRGQIGSLVDPYESEIVLDSVLLNNKEIYSSKSGSVKYFQEFQDTSLRDNANAFLNLMGLLNDSVLFLDHNRFLNSETENNSVALTANNFKNWLHNLSLNPLNYSKYLNFLSFVKNNNISVNSCRVLNEFDPTYARQETEMEVFLKTNSERLPLNSFGTGIMQILFILAKIYETNAKIILIEEIELNLSPRTQQELLQILGSLVKNKKIDQVIFTSHSDILSKISGLTIYQVELSETGVSKILYKEKPDAKFYKKITAISNQLASVVRECSVKGPEWD